MSAPQQETDDDIVSIAIDRHFYDIILEKLGERGIQPSPSLTVDVRDRVVTVSGRVTSYYQRQLIVHTVRLIPGIAELRDLIHVIVPVQTTVSLCPSWQSGPRWRDVANALALVTISSFWLPCGAGVCEHGRDSGSVISGGMTM
jgi:hypothetical protein